MRGRLADAWSALQAAFADRRLRRVQSAWSGTVTAEWAIIVGLGVWAFDAGGPVGVGVLTVARTVPAAVLGPLLTPLVDRHRRDRVLTTVTVLRFLMVAGMAVALLGHAAPTLVYVLAALDAVVYSLYWPAQSSLLTELARRPEELVAANVASTMIENIGGLAGPVIAALVLGVAGPALALATAGVLLAASALAFLPLSPERPPAPAAEERDGDARGDGPFAGFLHVARVPGPRVVAALYLSHTLAFGGLTVLLVVLALDRLGLGESGVGVLTAGMGAGGIAGSLMALGLVGQPRLARMLVVGVLAWSAALGLLGLAPSVAVAVGLLAAAGLSNALVDVTALTLLQRLVPPPLLGRVLGVVEGAWWGALGLGGLVASVLAAVLGVTVAFGLVGAVLAVLAVSVHARMDAIDREGGMRPGQLEALLQDPILGALPTFELERVAVGARMLSVAPGEVVIRQGAVGDHYYVIVTGAVEVSTPDQPVRLGAGQGFGEIALLRDVRRTATVTAVEPTILVAIERSAFLTAVRGHRHSAAAAATLADERVGSD